MFESMPIVEKSIVIEAPPEEVFAMQDDPRRVMEYVPGIVRVSDYTYTSRRVGDTARVTYSVLGLRFPTKVTVLEWKRNKRMVMRMDRGLRGTLTFDYITHGGFTRVTWRIDYTMKGGILGKAVNAFLVQRMNEKNAERTLENLKLICEAGEGGSKGY